MANTKYVFQVRSVYQDQEGQYGPESNDVLTAESASTSLLNSSKQVSNGIPPKYQLFVEELENSRNINAKTKQIVVGKFLLRFCMVVFYSISDFNINMI